MSENQANPSTEDASVKTQGKRDENKSPIDRQSGPVTDKTPVEKTAAETTASQNEADAESNQKPSADEDKIKSRPTFRPTPPLSSPAVFTCESLEAAQIKPAGDIPMSTQSAGDAQEATGSNEGTENQKRPALLPTPALDRKSVV